MALLNGLEYIKNTLHRPKTRNKRPHELKLKIILYYTLNNNDKLKNIFKYLKKDAFSTADKDIGIAKQIKT